MPPRRLKPEPDHSVGYAGDFVGEGIDSTDYFPRLGTPYALTFNRRQQMVHKAAEMPCVDAASMMDVGERAAGVSYWAAEGHREEFLLHGMEMPNGRIPEERLKFRIAHDAIVKGDHKRFDAGLTAQLCIKCGTVTHSPGNSTNDAILVNLRAYA